VEPQPPEPAGTPDRPVGVRASDHDRETALELLSAAASDGRLTLEEYSTRADQALAARALGELSELTADLQRPVAPASAEVEAFTAILGNESRKGHWRVPPRLRARSVLGDCHLELQDAVLTSHVTVIEAKATLGAVTIFVPDGVEVRLSGKSILGAKSSEVADAPIPGAPIIEVRATALLGNVSVLPPTLRRRRRGTLENMSRAMLDPPREG
jgi:Domain of unknown function (DUF1707)/Cell wall-active antibiotics response 4TMS YvqF